MKRSLILLMAFISTLLLSGAPALAHPNDATPAREIVVKGYGPSKDDALRDAMRNAVEKAVGSFVEAQTLVENASIVTDEIYTKAQGFVQDYRILREGKQGDQVVLTVRIKVNTQPNAALMTSLQRLKLIEAGLQDPRIGVIIVNSDQTPNQAGQISVIRKLRELGFKRVIDPQQAKNLYSDAFISSMEEDDSTAQTIAASYQLDYVILGSALDSSAGEVIAGAGMYSARASIEAKLLKTDTGEIIAAGRFESGGADISQEVAGQKALTKAGETLAEDIAKQFLDYASDTEKTFKIVAQQVTAFSQVNALQKELKDVPGVKAVYLRSYANGAAEFDVNFIGTSQRLADRLEQCSSVTLIILEIANSLIQVEMF
ncbi:hypothetical protein [Acetonema longum]|uniref:Flagellar assembly protein T N-terminal domain-containing protein n=1 Tax=Acetonema longum DSM 6540 TaxID=1009370 RepID=F7NIY4_9FIRM|nr:hypothetical protein [Acetonema longum]EGO63981.1 hypothetical protein ALO_10184 [Acetonema longum DSM 6540]